MAPAGASGSAAAVIAPNMAAKSAAGGSSASVSKRRLLSNSSAAPRVASPLVGAVCFSRRLRRDRTNGNLYSVAGGGIYRAGVIDSSVSYRLVAQASLSGGVPGNRGGKRINGSPAASSTTGSSSSPSHSSPDSRQDGASTLKAVANNRGPAVKIDELNVVEMAHIVQVTQQNLMTLHELRAEADAELIRTRRQVADLQEELRIAQAQLAEAEAEKKELEDYATRARAALQEAETQLKASIAKELDYAEQVEELERLIILSTQEKNAALESAMVAQEDVSTARSAIDMLQTEAEAFSERLIEAEERVRQVASERDALKEAAKAATMLAAAEAAVEESQRVAQALAEKLAQAEDRIELIESERQRLRETAPALSAALVEAEESLLESQEQRLELTQKMMEMEKEMEALEQERLRVTEAAAEAQRIAVETLEQRLERSTQESQALSAQLEEARSRVQELEALVDAESSASRSLAALEIELADARGQVSSLASELDSSRREVEDLQERVKAGEAAMQAVRDLQSKLKLSLEELDLAAQRESDLLERVVEADADRRLVADLDDRLAATLTDLESARSRVAQLEKIVAANTVELEAAAEVTALLLQAQKQFELLSRELEEAKERVFTLEEMANQAVEGRKKVVKDMEARLSAVTSENDLLSKELEAAKEKQREVENELSQAREYVLESRSLVEEAAAVLAKAKADAEELAKARSDVANLESVVEELKRTLDTEEGGAFDMKQKLERSRQETLSLVAELEATRKQIASLEEELAMAREGAQVDKNAIATLEQSLQLRGAESEDLSSKLRAAEEKLQSEQKNVEVLREELNTILSDQSKDKMEALQEQLRAAQDRVSASSTQIQQAEARLANLELEKGTISSSKEAAEAGRKEAEARTEALRVEYQRLVEEKENYINELENMNNTVIQRLEVLQGQVSGLEREKEELRAAIPKEDVYGMLAEERQRSDTLEATVRQLEERLKTILTEKESLLQQRMQAAQALEQAEFDSARILEQIAKMEARVAAMEEERGTMEKVLRRYALQAQNVGLPPEVDAPTRRPAFWTALLVRLDDLRQARLLNKDEHSALRLLAWSKDPKLGNAFSVLKDDPDQQLRDGLIGLAGVPKRPGVHIIHIAAEMAPVAKVGGLGDVVTGLGRAHQRSGHMVEIVLPKYDCMDYSSIEDLRPMNYEFQSFFDGELHNNKMWRGVVAGLPVYFLEPLHKDNFFWRGEFYGEKDDFARFTYFCRAALEFLYKIEKRPDVIHLHDWQTAAVAPLYWDMYAAKGWANSRIVLTCHNYEFQGTGKPEELKKIGLDPVEYNRPDKLADNFMAGQVNLLKGAIVYANAVTTVSPTYCAEARTPEGGRGLQTTLNEQWRKFSGVLNGIDNEIWDPANDEFLPFSYSAVEVSGKVLNKRALKETLKLSTAGDDDRKPLVAVVSRLVQQKGVHLIRHSIFRTLEQGGQFVLLGSSHDPAIKADFDALAREFADHPDCRLLIKYDERLAHMIYAGSDIFIIPSLFEPCGLTQLIAMRYGAIPVARKTGGLSDSVFDVDDPNLPFDSRNGFTFVHPDERGLESALDRAVRYYWDRPEWWRQQVVRTMRMDFSWDASGGEYVHLYRKILDQV